MSHLHTERFVFWKCEDGGQRLLEKEVFDGCLLAAQPAFPKLFLNITLQIIAPWCLLTFEKTEKSNVYMNTPQTFYQMFRVCC